MMKVAKRMCDWTRTAITTFLPITGTSRLPMGTAQSPLARGEVHDPADRKQHVKDDDYHHHDTYDRGEGPADGVVVPRAPVEPRDGEEEPDEDRRHNDGSEGDQRVSWKEHEHLLVEEEEPFGPGHVGDRRRVRRLGERRRGGVREHDAGDEDKGADVAVLEHLPWEERYGLVRTLEYVLFGDYFFFNRFGLASRRSVHLEHLSTLCPCPNRTSGTSVLSVKAVTPRPCLRDRGGPRKVPLRPRPSRSGRTLQGVAARAAWRFGPCTRTRCRTPRDA